MRRQGLPVPAGRSSERVSSSAAGPRATDMRTETPVRTVAGEASHLEASPDQHTPRGVGARALPSAILGSGQSRCRSRVPLDAAGDRGSAVLSDGGQTAAAEDAEASSIESCVDDEPWERKMKHVKLHKTIVGARNKDKVRRLREFVEQKSETIDSAALTMCVDRLRHNDLCVSTNTYSKIMKMPVPELEHVTEQLHAHMRFPATVQTTFVERAAKDESEIVFAVGVESPNPEKLLDMEVPWQAKCTRVEDEVEEDEDHKHDEALLYLCSYAAET